MTFEPTTASPMASVTPTAPARREPFYWRALASFFVVAGFAVLAVSGVVLYVTPPGRVATWSGWTLFALTKAQWQALHTVFALLFLVASVFHLYFNWRALLSYLRTRLRGGVRRGRELAWAGGIVAALAVLSVADVAPVSYLAESREAIANSWATAEAEPPLPHLELLSVSRLSEAVKIDAGVALERLAGAGLRAQGTDTLEAIAARSGLTPRDVYRLIAPDKDSQPAVTTAAVVGGGLGWRQLSEVALAAGLSPDAAIARLRAAGIEARATETLREIAERAGRRPPEIGVLLGIPATH